MPPFTIPKVVLTGLKEKFDSLTVQGKNELCMNCHLYVTNFGNHSGQIVSGKLNWNLECV